MLYILRATLSNNFYPTDLKNSSYMTILTSRVEQGKYPAISPSFKPGLIKVLGGGGGGKPFAKIGENY